MNCKEKFLNLLTICRKAGKLILGFDPAKEEIQSHRAAGVFVTADASPRTKKEVHFFCDKENIPVSETELSMEDIQNAVGRKAGVLAVCDKGFAKRLMELSDNMISFTE
ncbi:MAG: L7Ae/L30e/S12e/Gadd45 family ribosomal protein [Ruminococcus sp.]